MKFHRVLLFTKIQMDITKVGSDLHVLLTNDQSTQLIESVYSKVSGEGEDISCELSNMIHVPDLPENYCSYTAEHLSKATGQNVLCSGGLALPEEMNEHDEEKIRENLDDIIFDWIHFLD